MLGGMSHGVSKLPQHRIRDVSFSQQIGDKGRAEVVGREVYSRTPLEGAADQATPPGGVFIVRKGVTLTVLRGEGMEIHHGTCVIFTKKHQFNFFQYRRLC